MQAGSLVYVNARIKSLESTLLNQMQLTRLMDSESLEDAYKILTECGYGAGLQVDSCYDYELLLNAENRNAVNFLKENIVPNMGLEAFLIKVDYHNAKAIVKAKYMKLENFENLVNATGVIEIEELKDKIFADSYDSFSKNMKNALLEIDTEFATENRSPRIIDTLLDKAMYNDIFELLKNNKKSVIYKYFTTCVDLTNMLSFLRCRKLNLSLKYFEQSFMNGGAISQNSFTECFEQSLEVFREKMKFFNYQEIINKALEENGLVKAETAIDDYLLDMFRKDRNDMFSVSPIAGFYLAKLVEIKVVKLVITAVKNKVDKTLLKQRLRELYA